jgi:hypothetical protein
MPDADWWRKVADDRDDSRQLPKWPRRRRLKLIAALQHQIDYLKSQRRSDPELIEMLEELKKLD